ncbi:MAG TPA: hypothetical protein VGD37_28225 [Kofleriaceae bacterium]|jgi:hypothetical protein
MTQPRKIALVVRKVRRDELDEDAERLAYWRTRTPAERIAEVESLRRLWIEITGDPDLPMVRVVHRRRRGEPAIQSPR